MHVFRHRCVDSWAVLTNRSKFKLNSGLISIILSYKLQLAYHWTGNLTLGSTLSESTRKSVYSPSHVWPNVHPPPRFPLPLCPSIGGCGEQVSRFWSSRWIISFRPMRRRLWPLRSLISSQYEYGCATLYAPTHALPTAPPSCINVAPWSG